MRTERRWQRAPFASVCAEPVLKPNSCSASASVAQISCISRQCPCSSAPAEQWPCRNVGRPRASRAERGRAALAVAIVPVRPRHLRIPPAPWPCPPAPRRPSRTSPAQHTVPAPCPANPSPRPAPPPLTPSPVFRPSTPLPRPSPFAVGLCALDPAFVRNTRSKSAFSLCLCAPVVVLFSARIRRNRAAARLSPPPARFSPRRPVSCSILSSDYGARLVRARRLKTESLSPKPRTRLPTPLPRRSWCARVSRVPFTTRANMILLIPFGLRPAIKRIIGHPVRPLILLTVQPAQPPPPRPARCPLSDVPFAQGGHAEPGIRHRAKRALQRRRVGGTNALYVCVSY